MKRWNRIEIADFLVFVLMVLLAGIIFKSKMISETVGSVLLPEERNKAYYDILNRYEKVYADQEVNENTKFFCRYAIHKGVLDGEIVTADDWKVFCRSLRYQMPADKALIDFMDGTGIEVLKSDYPVARYSEITDSGIVGEAKTLNITDYKDVLNLIHFEEREKNLCEITDFYEYFKALSETEYTIFMAINEEGVNGLNRESDKLIRKLGLSLSLIEPVKEDITEKLYFRNSFCAVLKQGRSIQERIGKERLEISGTLQDGTTYRVKSAGSITGEILSSIQIDGIEYAVSMRGLNMVVYDEIEHRVVDTVCFNTWHGLQCYR